VPPLQKPKPLQPGKAYSGVRTCRFTSALLPVGECRWAPRGPLWARVSGVCVSGGAFFSPAGWSPSLGKDKRVFDSTFYQRSDRPAVPSRCRLRLLIAQQQEGAASRPALYLVLPRASFDPSVPGLASVAEHSSPFSDLPPGFLEGQLTSFVPYEETAVASFFCVLANAAQPVLWTRPASLPSQPWFVSPESPLPLRWAGRVPDSRQCGDRRLTAAAWQATFVSQTGTVSSSPP
jgi:hypothetical protein